jgi:class 3 adenylate cyclase
VGKTINADFVVSADMLDRIALPADVRVHDRGEYTLNGVANPLRVYSLTSERKASSEGAGIFLGEEARSAAE